MARKQIAPHSILGTLEIFAVFGIFGLYALEFAGIHTFSQLLPDQGMTGTPALSFVSTTGESVFISTGTVAIMAIVGLIIVVYFAFLRKKLR